MRIFTFFLLCLPLLAQNWPQAQGPNLNYRTEGKAPVTWNLKVKNNIKWKITLPEGGQSTPVIWGNKLFLTMNKPVDKDCILNDTLIAMCIDKNTGEVLWQRQLKGHWQMRMNAIFSDATVCSPVTDGKTVCFCSPTGIIAAFDFKGKEKWRYSWEEAGGYNIRQHEPFAIDNRLFMVVERDETFKKPDSKALVKKSWGYWGRRKFIRCFNLENGKIIWDAECDTSPHCTALPAKNEDGRYTIFTARGGGHNPPEKNHGLSVIDADTGKELMSSKFLCKTSQNLNSDASNIYILEVDGMHILDKNTGKEKRTFKVDPGLVTEYIAGVYKTSKKSLKGKKNKGLTKFSNLLIGDWYLFMSDKPGFIGRINLKTELTEYVQVPLETDGTDMNWDKHTPPPVQNSRGLNVKGDTRSSGSGWGHLGAVPPAVVGDYIYFTVMPGTVYVLKWNAAKFNQDAVAAVNNLGPPGKTWTLAGFAYSEGKLYTRTVKELICIGN